MDNTKYYELPESDLPKIIEEKNQEIKTSVGRCNILIIGKTGAGKSTIVNSIFGAHLAEARAGAPVTNGIREYSQPNFPIKIYDTAGLTLNIDNRSLYQILTNRHSEAEVVMKEVEKLIDNQHKKLDLKEHIHIIWYLPQAPKLEKAEKDWLERIYEINRDLPIILVVNKEIVKDSDFYRYLVNLRLPGVRSVVSLLAVAELARTSSEQDIIKQAQLKIPGVEDLVRDTFSILPDIAKKEFLKKQIIDLNLKEKEALPKVNKYAIFSGAISFGNPIPLTSLPLIASIQIKMLAEINDVFDLQFAPIFTQQVLFSIGKIGGVVIASSVGYILTLVSVIPGAVVVNNTIEAVISSGTTMAIGYGYIQALKYYLTQKNNGSDIPLDTLVEIITQKVESFAHSGIDRLRPFNY